MTQITFDLKRNGDALELSLSGDMTGGTIRSTILDTYNGTDVRTVVTLPDGTEQVLTDKVDRGTPPLQLMASLMNSLFEAFAVNGQATLNKIRYERLVRDGKPITMQNMCMDGAHTGPEYADKPFQGGIVGVPTVPDAEEQSSNEAVSNDFLNSLWGDDEDGVPA